MTADPQVQALAQQLKDLEARNVNDAIERALANHGVLHERGNRLAFEIYFDQLDDVNMTGKADGDVPTWNATDGLYKPGAGGGGKKRELGYQVPGTLAVSAGGPTIPNITGATITFTTAIATVGTAPVGADLLCTLDVDGTTVSFTITDGNTSSTKQTGLSVAWAADTLITGAISQVGSGTAGSDLSMVLAE